MAPIGPLGRARQWCPWAPELMRGAPWAPGGRLNANRSSSITDGIGGLAVLAVPARQSVEGESLFDVVLDPIVALTSLLATACLTMVAHLPRANLQNFLYRIKR